MRLRLLKNVRMSGAPTVEIQAGAVVELPEDTGRKWIAAGYAEVWKESEDIETAVMPGVEQRNEIENKAAGAVVNKKSPKKTGNHR